jgi:hypothetical protein
MSFDASADFSQSLKPKSGINKLPTALTSASLKQRQQQPVIQPWAVLSAGVNPLVTNKNSKLLEKPNCSKTSAVPGSILDKAETKQSESSMSGSNQSNSG